MRGPDFDDLNPPPVPNRGDVIPGLIVWILLFWGVAALVRCALS
jgi:hypothetical protein